MVQTVCTDHRLVVSKLNLRIQSVRRTQGKRVPKKLDVSKLKQDSKRQAFVNDLCSRLGALEHSSVDVDESWISLQRHHFLFSNGFPRTSITQKLRNCLIRTTKKFRDSLKRNTKKHKAGLRLTDGLFVKL